MHSEPTVIDDTADIKPVIIPLIETSDKAGSLKTEGLYEKKIIGLSIKSKTNNSNIVLLGDGDFATNSFYSIGDNGRFFNILINELAEVDNVIQIEPKSYKQDVLSLTSNQAAVLFLVATLALPIIFLVLGVYVFFILVYSDRIKMPWLMLFFSWYLANRIIRLTLTNHKAKLYSIAQQ